VNQDAQVSEETYKVVLGAQMSEETSQVTPVDMSVYKVGDNIEVMYREKKYVAEIMSYDVEENEYFVSFMRRRKNGTYYWPKQKEESWVTVNDIVGHYKL
jgi:hypothetical protein